MKIWKILLMVLAVAVGAPTASMAAEGHAKRTVASAKTKKKKAKKAKGAKHAKGKKKKHGKVAKGKKGKKAKKLAAASGSGHGHQSHAPAQNPVAEPVPSVEIPEAAKDDLPPPNTGALSE